MKSGSYFGTDPKRHEKTFSAPRRDRWIRNLQNHICIRFRPLLHVYFVPPEVDIVARIIFCSSTELVGETVLLGASPKPRNFTH